MKYHIFIVALLLQFISILTPAQNRQLRFERIGIKEGLSDPIVLCMMQDSRGFIWVGTRRGLNRYDGHQFKVYLHKFGDSTRVSDNYIQNIIEDSKGYIWVATSNGLNRFDRKKNIFKQYFHTPGETNSLSGNRVNSIIEDKTGKFWIGTNEGLDVFDQETNRFTHFTHNQNDKNSLSDNYVSTLYNDSRGDIWIGTQDGGLNKFNPGDSSFTHYQTAGDNIAITGNKINAIFEDSRNQLWVGTNHGLILLDRETNEFRKFMHIPGINSLSGNTILSLNEDDDGNLLIGVENGGINILDSSLRNFRNYMNDEIDVNSLSANSVYSILKDNQENIWVGVFAGGINLHIKNSANFNHYKHNSSAGSLSNNFVLSIFGDDHDNIWVGTDGGGLNCFNQKTGKSSIYKEDSGTNSIAGNYVITVTGDKKNNLWIGTWGKGLSKFNLETKKFTNFKSGAGNRGLSSDNIYSIMVAKNGKIWIGTFGNGIDIYDEETNTFVNYKNNLNDKTSLSHDKIYSIIEDKAGRIWIATAEGGINLYEPDTKSFTRFNIDNKRIMSNTVYYLLETGNGKIYACTSGIGMVLLDEATNTFLPLESQDKFSSDFVYAALEDKTGNIWLSSNKGLTMYDPYYKKVMNYSSEDGLQADEFKPHSAFKAKNGMLYFGGINGYNSFFPDQIVEKNFNAPISITDLKIFNRAVPIAQNENDPSPLKEDISETESIELTYDQSVITFEFATLDYSHSDKKNYAYFLEGFDKDWNYVTNKNSATYTNLNHGSYVFKVRSQNNKGVWSDSICSIDITITPPFWLTWWFKTLMGLILVIVPILITYFRIRQLNHQRARLEEMVAERTIEIQNKNELLKELNSTKDKLFSIISHDLRSPFSAILGFQDLLVSNYSGYTDEERIEMLRQVQSTTNQVYYLVENLLSWSRIQTNSIKPIPVLFNLKEILPDKIDLYQDIAKVKGITLESKIPDNLEGYADINIMTGVLRNLINNSIKFTPNGGKITISAEQENNHVLISVNDTGTGMSTTQINELFSIETTKSKQGTNGEPGSGLGLILCKEFTEKNKGQLRIESEEGKGSTFSFTIPLKPQQ